MLVATKGSAVMAAQARKVTAPAVRRASTSVAVPRQAQAARAERYVQRSRIVAASGMPGAAGTGMSPELKRSIDEFIEKNKIVVFMKGTKQAPLCGFSAKVVQILTVMDASFETVNILEDERLRSGMKEYSMWPTFPQVYINGEFFGGADIILEAAQNGQLKEALEVAQLE